MVSDALGHSLLALSIGYWLLAIGYWLLAIGYWLFFGSYRSWPFWSGCALKYAS